MDAVGLYRNDTGDAFFTKPEVAKTMLIRLNALYPFSQFDIIVEPSAGSGAFSDNLKTYNLEAYDIAPHKRYIRKRDFLTIDVSRYHAKRALVVGNPPFGRQSGLARKFVRHCGEFADVIAFILPKSFKKKSMQDVFPDKYHLIKQYQVPPNSFVINGVDHDVPCVFQIWELQEHARRNRVVDISASCIEFTKKDEPHDFSIRRIGVNAGQICVSTQDKSEQSHYFIKLKQGTGKRAFLAAYKNIRFANDNTVGPRSISKPELVAKLNCTLE